LFVIIFFFFIFNQKNSLKVKKYPLALSHQAPRTKNGRGEWWSLFSFICRVSWSVLRVAIRHIR
jgi:hypothetical protein